MSDVNGGNEAWIQRAKRALLGNYRPQPLVVSRGEGVRLFDENGKSYLDLVSGIAVSSLGHGHPRLVKAVQEQAAAVIHTANIMWNKPNIEAAEQLVAKSFGEKVFFCNSGAEANEAMLKLARKVFHDRGEGRFEIITAERSFHGRTMATITATGQEKYRVGFEPLVPGFRYVPWGDIDAIEGAITERTAAVLLEPIQGEGGVRIPPTGYMKAVRELCSKHGCLFLLDEVQTGIGRTGTLFAYEQEGIEPDIMSLAKGLGGGMPIGAMVTSNAIAEHLTFGSHGSTFGGNPVACAAANVVIDEVSRPEFLAHVKELGEHTMSRLNNMCRQYKRVAIDARGRGLLCGLELAGEAAKDIPARSLEQGVITNVIGGKVIRIAPPLTITREELDEGLDVVESLVSELARG